MLPLAVCRLGPVLCRQNPVVLLVVKVGRRFLLGASHVLRDEASDFPGMG
jgi:hypothetical protein